MSTPPSPLPITLNPEVERLLPPLSEDEHARLEVRLLEEGCRDPLVTWNGILLDGHARFQICRAHGLPFSTVEKAFPSREAALAWVIQTQLARRNLTPYARATLALRLEPLVKAQAKRNQGFRRDLSHDRNIDPNDRDDHPNDSNDRVDRIDLREAGSAPSDGRREAELSDGDAEAPFPSGEEGTDHLLMNSTRSPDDGASSLSPPSPAPTSRPACIPVPASPPTGFEPVHTRATLAKRADVSPDTLRKAKVIEAHADPATKERLLRGEETIHSAYLQARLLEGLPEERRAAVRVFLEGGTARDMKEAVRMAERQARLSRSFSPPPSGCIVEERDNIAHVADGSVDLVLVDPPYAISEPGKVTKAFGRIVAADFDGGDDWDASEGYRDRLDGWVGEWARVARPGGAVISFIDRAKVSLLWELFERHGLVPKSVIVWEKSNPAPTSLARKNLISATEFLVWAVKPGAGYTFNVVSGWDRRNVITAPAAGGSERVDHPCQKPLAVLRPLIELTTDPGDLVLDPMAGSGSTGIAALQLGRRGHLVEKDPHSLALLHERLERLDREEWTLRKQVELTAGRRAA
ncbi:MAG: DNA modification methylase [Armatimonadetes bacterium]|nr:DNA modification methylase [Armatimonadota bacterium]